MSYSPADDEPIIDFEPNPSTDSTDDDSLLFTDDNPIISNNVDNNPTDSTASKNSNGGNMLNTLSIMDLSPPADNSLPVVDTAIKAAPESSFQPPPLNNIHENDIYDNDDVVKSSGNFGVVGVAVVAVGILVLAVVRARSRHHRQQLMNRSREDGGEVGTDLEDDASVWSAADQDML